MPVQYGVAVLNAKADSIESTIGTAPIFRGYGGSVPATPATAPGTVIAEGTAASDWLTAASDGVKNLSGTLTLTGQAAAGAGTNMTYIRAYDSAGSTCHAQYTVKTPVSINTSAATSANGNVLTFTSTTGAAVGDNVSGTGIVAGTTVLAVTGTTVTLSRASTAGVSSGATITFSGDVSVDNVNIASGQALNVSAITLTEANG